MNEADLKTLLASAIRQRRAELRLTQEELAWRAGVHRTYLAGIERGYRNPSLESIGKLADALEMPVATLFGKAAERLMEGRALTKTLQNPGQRVRLQTAALESAGNSIFITDRQGIILWVNPAFTDLTGYQPQEALGATPRMLKSGKHSEQFYKDFWKCIIAGNTWRGEFINRRKDGSFFHVENTVTPVMLDGKSISNFVGIMSDITQTKEAELALLENERHFRATFEQAAVGMVHTGLDGRFRRVNEKLAEILGYSREELLGKSFREITHPDDLDASLRELDRLVAGAITTFTMEKRYIRKDGAEVWGALTVSVVRRQDGAPDYFIGVVEDVTAKRNLELQLRQSQKMDAIGQLAGGVAHDFNNILGAMMIRTELIELMEGLSPALLQELEELRASAERAASLTQQLLLFSRRQAMRPRLLDLNQGVKNLAKMLRRIIGEDVRLDLILNTEPLFLRVDQGMLDQLLLNLVVNARDAMPRGGRVEVRTARRSVEPIEIETNTEATPGEYVVLSVTDTGCGISKEVLPHIFEPFFTTKEPGKGTGLGLATVFGIVKQHRGWIEVRSEPGQGATFQVYLPAANVAEGAAAQESTKSTLPGGSESLLLVEDDVVLRRITERLLRRYGYTIFPAGNAAEALTVWAGHKNEIALLLTDLVLPGEVGGPDLAASLLAERGDLKVLFTSGYIGSKSAREIESHNFLQKPASPESLLLSIRRAIEQ